LKTISPSLKCYRKKAAEFKRRGLTVLGKRFKRTPNFKTRAEKIEARRRRGLAAWEKISARRRLAGLTTRGGERIYQIHHDDALALRSSVMAAAKSCAKVFNQVPQSAQADLLELSHHLSALLKSCE